jgi:hypothetical protein
MERICIVTHSSVISTPGDWEVLYSLRNAASSAAHFSFVNTIRQRTQQFPMKRLLLYLLVLTSPFFMFAVAFGRDTLPMWIVVIMFLYLYCTLLIEGGTFWFERSSVWLVLFVSVYLLWTLYIVIADPGGSWLGRTQGDRAVTTLLRIIYVAGLFIVCSSILVTEPKSTFLKILRAQMLIGSLLALFGVIQYVAVTVFGYSGFSGIAPTNASFAEKSSFFRLGAERVYRATSVFNEPAWFGLYLAPLMTKIVAAKLSAQKIFDDFFDWIILLVVSLAVVVNLSFTAILSLAVVAILYLLDTLRKKGGFRFLKHMVLILFAAAAALVLIGGFVLSRLDRMLALQDPSTIDRLFRLYTGVTVFWDNLWLGLGPGGYAFIYPKLGGLDRTIMASPLNFWLTFLTDVGLIGCVPFFCFLASILRRMNRNRRKDPLLEVFWWGTIAYLVVLSTTDYWYGELFWTELAISLTLIAAMRSADVHPENFGKPAGEQLQGERRSG